MRSAAIVAAILAIASSSIGCGSGDDSRAAVRGTVTLDGAPLENGHVTFTPIEGSRGPLAGATIVAGRYDVPAEKGAVVGKVRVEIRGVRKTGRQIPFGPGTTDEVVSAVPPEYNADSVLVRDVEPGVNEFDFELKSR